MIKPGQARCYRSTLHCAALISFIHAFFCLGLWHGGLYPLERLQAGALLICLQVPARWRWVAPPGMDANHSVPQSPFPTWARVHPEEGMLQPDATQQITVLVTAQQARASAQGQSLKDYEDGTSANGVGKVRDRAAWPCEYDAFVHASFCPQPGVAFHSASALTVCGRCSQTYCCKARSSMAVDALALIVVVWDARPHCRGQGRTLHWLCCRAS